MFFLNWPPPLFCETGFLSEAGTCQFGRQVTKPFLFIYLFILFFIYLFFFFAAETLGLELKAALCGFHLKTRDLNSDLKLKLVQQTLS